MSKQQTLLELEAELKKLISTEMGRRSFLTALPLLMTACATSGQTRYREGDNRGQATSMTVGDEVRMTAEVLPKMKQEYPVIPNPELQRYISNLGTRIAIKNGLQGNPYNYNFSVVDVGYVNAFALPAGTVFITAPLIAMADSEAELAGVVGHEIGHIQARHTAERMHAQNKSKGKSLLLSLGTGLLGAAAGYGLGQVVCRRSSRAEEKACLNKTLQLGAVAGFSGGLLIQQFGFMANSREDEMEADRISFNTAFKAGYHKDYVGKFYDKLLVMNQQSHGKQQQDVVSVALADVMSTHPPSINRVNQMKQMASTVQNPAGTKISTKSFERAKSIAKQYAARAQSAAKARS